MRRWTIFIAERFPLASHVPMILSFTLANVFMGLSLHEPARIENYLDSLKLPGADAVSITRVAIAFTVALAFFLRLRIFDEIKDFETDLKVNPTRPLARGLIKIPEAKIAVTILTIFELALLAILSPWLALSHLLAVAYSFLMYQEFFIGDILRPHLTTYAVLHTFVSVLVGATIMSTVTGLMFWEFSRSPWFFALANWGFFNLFEFARKTFAPSEEREGVESYSKVFSIPGAVSLSLSQAVVPLLLVSNIADASFTPNELFALWSPLVLVGGPALAFVIRPRVFAAKMFRNFVGLYLIAGYLSLVWVLGS